MVDSLGGFEVTKIVEDTTTHVVCGATRRTVNVLAGTAKGCWLLSVDWVSGRGHYTVSGRGIINECLC